MAAPGPSTDRLTSSSQVALAWASWFAAARGDAAHGGPPRASKMPTRPPSAVDTLDLLLGILFAHPADSEPIQLLDHFQIPLSSLQAALPEDHRVDLSALPHRAPTRRSDVDFGEVDHILRLAGDLAQRSKADQGLARIADLFGALIQSPSDPAVGVLSNLLVERGASADVGVLGSEYSTFLEGLPSTTYAAFLDQTHPWAQRTALIAGYDADAVRSGTEAIDDDSEPGAPQDFVGISDEVDAFAYLIAARALIPPLAIGLFGDWGSGKSFFMQALQRRIDRLTEKARSSPTPQRDLPIHKYVVQIQFNAWHYVEGNLWASLVEHIFSNLRTSPKDKIGLLEQRRERVTRDIGSAQLARDQVRKEIEAEQGRLASAQQARRALETEQQVERQALEDKAKAVAEKLAKDLDPDVGAILTRMGYPQVGASVADFAAAIAETRAVLQRGNGVARGLQDGRPGWVFAIIAVIALGPVVSWVLISLLHVESVTTILTSVAAVLAGATTLLRQGTTWTSDQLKKLEKAQQVVAGAQSKLDADKLDADRKLASIEAELHAKQDAEQALTSRLVDLERELQAITPGKVLSDFIDARVGSDDYRKHLGLTALVRKDFEDLWKLIAKEEKTFLEQDDGTPDGPESRGEIGRIVLYIDDLDRCPPRVVTNVLQAIHLLLAFPLFVVVVAVDARWLSSSLQKQYGDLFGKPRAPGGPDPSPAVGADDQATPDDYLEKIFQVPFWVRPLDAQSRSRIVQGLVAPSLTAEHGTAEGEANIEAEQEGPEDEAVTRLCERLASDDEPKLEPESLKITAGELAFMQSLAPLLGDSPRAVKRFVNVYRLMKSLAEGRDITFMDEVPRSGYKLVLFLLAVVTGMPDVSPLLFRSIGELHQPPTRTLAQFAKTIGTAHPTDAAALQAWLGGAEDGAWGTVKLADLGPWSRKMARFSFRTEVS